jgi:hypothetical protein
MHEQWNGLLCTKVCGLKQRPIAKLKTEIIHTVYPEHSVTLLLYTLVGRHCVYLISGE